MARPIPGSIRALRAQIKALREETGLLRARNAVLAKNEELVERVRELEKVLRDPLPELWNLPLTNSKRRMLGILYRTLGVVPRERMGVTMFGLDKEVSDKCLDVHLSGLRKRCRPHGITIETIWGLGYQLTPDSRATVRALIDKQVSVAAAAMNPIARTRGGGQYVGA